MAKEYRFSMTQNLKDLASNKIYTKNDVNKLLLESISLINYMPADEHAEGDVLILRIDKMKRLIFNLQDKIFSIHFPFNLITENDELKVHDPRAHLELSDKNLAIVRSTFQDILVNIHTQSLFDIESELFNILDGFENVDLKDNIWEVLKTLMSYEVGYLRYDYDEKRAKGKLHPLNHLDINYTTGNSYKIGLNKRVESKEFMDLLDTGTDCRYLEN